MQAPEMVRVPLEELVLQIHLLGLGPAGQFLEKVLEPPPKASVEGALTHLQALGALTSDQQLTPLGLSAQPHHVCVNVFNKKHVAHVPGYINYILLYHAHTHQHTACQSVDQCSLKWLLNMSDSKSLSTIMIFSSTKLETLSTHENANFSVQPDNIVFTYASEWCTIACLTIRVCCRRCMHESRCGFSSLLEHLADSSSM